MTSDAGLRNAEAALLLRLRQACARNEASNGHTLGDRFRQPALGNNGNNCSAVYKTSTSLDLYAPSASSLHMQTDMHIHMLTPIFFHIFI